MARCRRSSEAAGAESPANADRAGLLDALSDAVESGAGLPAVARAAARLLDASVALIDRSSAVLAVAGASSDQEQKLLSGGEGVTTVELRVADTVVGELRYRAKAAPDPVIARMVTTLLALELERSRSPEWESEEAAGAFVPAVLRREVTDRARHRRPGRRARRRPRPRRRRRRPAGGAAGGADGRVAGAGAGPGAAGAALAGARARWRPATAARRRPRSPRSSPPRTTSGWPGPPPGSRASSTTASRGFHLTTGRSRRCADPVDLYRAGSEARLAVNVGEAEGRSLLAFEDTGAYRLLLPAMSEDPAELERFYAETIQPLVDYDEQYETELVATVEAYLDNDGNVAATAKQLFTHRHTIRYRLERVRELCGHDVSSTEGREKLGLGLKAMRVLGIASPRGPAMEPGAKAARCARATEE